MSHRSTLAQSGDDKMKAVLNAAIMGAAVVLVADQARKVNFLAPKDAGSYDFRPLVGGIAAAYLVAKFV